MTDEQIIKYWNEIDSEIINEHGEEFDVYITMPVAKSTVDLISRQKAEIERLERKANTPFCQVTFDEEKLKEIANEYAENIEFDLNQLKSETIKEFAENLKEEMRLDDDCKYDCAQCHYDCKDYIPFIDNLVKEMTEEKDES